MWVKGIDGFESNKICVRCKDVVCSNDYEVSGEGGRVDEIIALQRQVSALNERVDKLEGKWKSEMVEARNVQWVGLLAEVEGLVNDGDPTEEGVVVGKRQ